MDLIVFDARMRKEYRAGDTRGAIGRPQRVEVTFGMRGDIVSGGNCVAVVEVPPGWTWKDGVARALSKLRQLRYRPVVFSPPSASIVAIVIGGAFATRGGSFAVRLTRFLFGFLCPGIVHLFSECD